MFSCTSIIDSRGAGSASPLPEFGGPEKGQSLITAYRSLAITASTSGFEKLSTALCTNTHQGFFCQKEECHDLIFRYQQGWYLLYINHNFQTVSYKPYVLGKAVMTRRRSDQ